MANRIEITGIPEEKVVAALFNASTPRGMGYYQYQPRDIGDAEAIAIINDHKTSPFGQRGNIRNFYLDYVEGRLVKCQFVHEGERTYVESDLRDRDYGDGATQRVIDALRESMGTPSNASVEAAEPHHEPMREPPVPETKPDAAQKAEEAKEDIDANAEAENEPQMPTPTVDVDAFKVTDGELQERAEQFKVTDGKKRDGDIMQFFRRRNG